MAKKPAKPQAKKNPGEPGWLKWLAIGAIALAILAAVFYMFGNKGSSNANTLPAEISVEEAYKLYNEGAFVLDVRTPEEWNEYHAPNTTLIPLDELEARVSEVPADKTVVVVCRSGNRSQQGRDILLAAGLKNVTSMAGGLKAWSAAGYPTTTGP